MSDMSIWPLGRSSDPTGEVRNELTIASSPPLHTQSHDQGNEGDEITANVSPRSPRTLSSLEALPLEIQEQILVLSANVELAHSSSALEPIIKQNTVRRAVVGSVFDGLRRQPTSDEDMRHFRSLQREHWFSWNIIKQARRRFYLGKVRRFLRDHLKMMGSEILQHKEEFERSAHGIETHLMSMLEQDPISASKNTDHISLFKHSSVMQPGDPFSKSMRLDVSFAPNDMDMEALVFKMKVSLREPQNFASDVQFTDKITFCLHIDLGRTDMDLLRGPWSQSQGDYVEFLLQVSGATSHRVAVIEAFSDGLLTALETACIPALTLYGCLGSTLEHEAAGMPLGSTGIGQVLPHPRTTDEWVKLNFGWVGSGWVPFKPKHFIPCIRNYYKDPAIYYEVLKNMVVQFAAEGLNGWQILRELPDVAWWYEPLGWPFKTNECADTKPQMVMYASDVFNVACSSDGSWRSREVWDYWENG